MTDMFFCILISFLGQTTIYVTKLVLQDLFACSNLIFTYSVFLPLNGVVFLEQLLICHIKTAYHVQLINKCLDIVLYGMIHPGLLTQ